MVAIDRPTILVTGAAGQIGSELTLALRTRYGPDQVIATGHRTAPSPSLHASGPFEFIDVTQPATIHAVIQRHRVNTIYHLSAILSAAGEKNPQQAWDVNMDGLYNVLEVARQDGVQRVFAPSSIAVFGPETPRENTPQETVLRPRTMYGLTKVAGELLSNYYFYRYGLDVRGVRYPGIISSETLPGGGTTDYAVAIFYEAIAYKHYTCFLAADTFLPMMYMPDCIRSAIELMETDLSRLKHHADFNLAAMSFSPAQLVAAIQQYIPDFVCEYQPDFRQQIADSWPRSIDDSAARDEWGWRAEHDLQAMVQDMIARITTKLQPGLV